MDILCCRITIGDADPSNPMRIQNGVEITEVQSLEINESYKKLIGTAKVIFPKGSVCRSTIIGNVTLEGKDVSRITTEVMQDGVIIEKRSAQRLVDETTFKVGQRINIKLGYNGVLKNMFDGYDRGKVHICKGAYLGMNTLVVKPVTIGERAIIGAGSVVTKDIPANEVWAGNPAKFIRKR